MNEAQKRLRTLGDDHLPAMPAMLGPESIELIGAAVAGADARALSARPVQVTWRPGRSLFVSYDVDVAWGKNHRATDRFVAATGQNIPVGAILLARGEQKVALWRMTGDPSLPGLSVAMDPQRAREILHGLGVGNGMVSPRIRAYRPGRRAVVELIGNRYRLFLKVLPPSEVPALQERHRIMAECLPVPRSHGWSSEYGLVVLAALPGATLRTVLLDKKQDLPDPQAFTRILDLIPHLSDGRTAQSPVTAVSEHALLIKSLLPELTGRVERLEETFRRCSDSGPRVPVHGDLHEAQVLLTNGAVTGVLDIDTAAMGSRMDDWATFVGHLATWETSAPPAARPRIARFTRQLLAAADAEALDPAELRRRVAAVIVGMATGPFRAQSRNWPADTRLRITLAERWAAEAEEETT